MAQWTSTGQRRLGCSWMVRTAPLSSMLMTRLGWTWLVKFGKTTRSSVWTLSLRDVADVYFDTLELSADGIQGILITPGGSVRVQSSLLGSFNASNLAMAVGLCQAVDLRVEDIERGLPSLSIRGRMERIQVKAPFTVVVDYAHSPDALERVIKALRPLCQGHLWCIRMWWRPGYDETTADGSGVSPV